MTETRKIAAILAADVVGFSRMTGADEDRTLARLRALRVDLIDPTVASQNGRVFKRTGDGVLVEFRSVVEAVRCAIAIQNAMIERNVGMPADQRIEFRIGIHLGDVVEESDGDLMGDGVNIAARLEGVAGAGAICLSDQAYWQVKGRLDLAVTDLGPKQLKNIAEPIRAYSLEVGKPGLAKPASAPASEKSAPPRLSIVVLPFANIGGGEEQEHFVDGVTESLTTDLSRIRGAFVIGRNTAFTYKGKAVDLKHIGRDLNVRYVLEGSVQRGGNRMRVNVQLIDAETGNHLWAERFDKSISDLFDMQDEIVARLANALGTQLVSAEARRAEQVPSPDSMDLYFQGRAWFNKGTTPEYFSRAREFSQRALALDPVNVEALVLIAAVDAMAALNYFSDDRATRLAKAEAAVISAVSLAPEHATAHLALAIIQIQTNRVPEGIAKCERALELDRNLAIAHGILGQANIYRGTPEETVAHIHDALRLSPHDPHCYFWNLFAGLAKFHLGEEEAAAAWLRKSVESNTNYPTSHLYLAAVLARLGRLSEARSEAEAGLSMNPTFAVSRFRAAVPSDNPTFLVGRDRLIDGLRLAGVPEH